MANSNSGCHTATSEIVDCHDNEDYYVVVDIDTSVNDPSLSAEIRDQDGNLESSWSILRSELQP